MSKVVSIIPARGGSKGIPKKNIVPLAGKPLIAHTIEASLQSEAVETWVSTDDDEIEEISLQYGAKVLRRPEDISQDWSSSEDALLHFAETVEFDYMVFIQATSPLLKGQYINKGINMLNSFDSVFSAYEDHWKGLWSEDGVPINYTMGQRPMRQDTKQFAENGAFYITSKQSLIDTKLRLSGKIGIVEMPFEDSFQIDSFDDLRFVEKLMVESKS